MVGMLRPSLAQLNCLCALFVLVASDVEAKPLLSKRTIRRTCAGGVVSAALLATAVALGPKLYDFRLTPSEEKEKDDAKILGKTIGMALAQRTQSQRGRDAATVLNERLKRLEPTITIFRKPTENQFQGYFDSKLDHLLPAIFFDPDLKSSGPNWHMAYRLVVEYAERFSESSPDELGDAYRKFLEFSGGRTLKELLPAFKSMSLEQLKTLLEPFTKLDRNDLPQFRGSKWGWKYSELPPEKQEEIEFKLRDYVDWLSHVSTPLFLKVMGSPDDSISQAEFLKMALETYDDPLTALGVIGFLTSYDAEHTNLRNEISLISRKIKSVLPVTTDRGGNLYHYWVFLLRSIYFKGNAFDNRLSWGFETIYQSDRDDRVSDILGMEAGTSALKSMGR